MVDDTKFSMLSFAPFEPAHIRDRVRAELIEVVELIAFKALEKFRER